MTVPSEHTRAVIETRRLLEQLAHGHAHLSDAQLREHAMRLLRHYPNIADMRLTPTRSRFGGRIPSRSVTANNVAKDRRDAA
ncbi:BPSL0761 family protein [Variovorax ureilyticus]|uniref:BPSL0761 family protein n=1 Tax=Variovorax ureilyticus TaxID=1836198 RepID=UPI003D675C5E